MKNANDLTPEEMRAALVQLALNRHVVDRAEDLPAENADIEELLVKALHLNDADDLGILMVHDGIAPGRLMTSRANAPGETLQ